MSESSCPFLLFVKVHAQFVAHRNAKQIKVSSYIFLQIEIKFMPISTVENCQTGISTHRDFYSLYRIGMLSGSKCLLTSFYRLK